MDPAPLSARTAGAKSFPWTGRQWTQATAQRSREVARGVGIYPRVWPEEGARIASEVPVTSRDSLMFGTTALAQLGGITPRKPGPEDSVSKRSRERTCWNQYDLVRGGSDRSGQLRPVPPAGLNSARMGWVRQRPMDRMGVEDRPAWMSEDETLPGGWDFSPSLQPGGPPNRFAIRDHFTHGAALRQSLR